MIWDPDWLLVWDPDEVLVWNPDWVLAKMESGIEWTRLQNGVRTEGVRILIYASYL